MWLVGFRGVWNLVFVYWVYGVFLVMFKVEMFN